MRRKKSLETKSRIYQSTLELFEQNGTADLSVEEIAARAGISKPTFYFYYESKYDVIKEIMHRYDEVFYESLQETLKDKPVAEKLYLLIENVFRLVRDKIGKKMIRELYQSRLAEKHITHASVATEMRFYREMLDLLEEGQRQGIYLSYYTPDQLAVFVLCAMNGALYTWSITDQNLDLIQEGIPYIQIFVKGISVSGDKPGENPGSAKGEKQE